MSARADLSAELGDAAARLSYGFYVGDLAVVTAAEAVLQRLPDSPDVSYYRALAALRSLQLGAPGEASGSELANRCIEHGSAATLGEALTAEAWILIAACSDLAARGAPLRAKLYQRRRDKALMQARELMPDNPRALWVRAWIAGALSALQGAALDADSRAALTVAVEAFQRRDDGLDGPDWGEAEALTCYGAALLAEGDVRQARDMLEQALLAAPGYRAALELLEQIAPG
jgi:hypothetical protein